MEGLTLKLHLAIYLRSNNKEKTLYSDMGEWYPPFLIAYWSPDSKMLGVYAANRLGSPPYAVIAYDLQHDRPVDVKAVLDNIRQEIISQYKVQLGKRPQAPGFDVLDWTSTPEANDAFRARLNNDGEWLRRE
jgi:hypothetical protein